MPLQLSVVTPSRLVLDAPVDQVVAPGAEGEFGVLPEHEAYLIPLQPGVLRYRGERGPGRMAVSSGFAEVTDQRVTVLVQVAEPSDRIDRAAADADRARLEEQLRYAGTDTPEEEKARLREELDLAVARLAAAGTS